MFGKLYFSNQMLEFLSTCPIRRIAEILLHGRDPLLNEDGNFITQEDFQSQVDYVSYLPSSKYGKLEDPLIDPYTKGIGRTKIKIGRFLRKFIKTSTLESISISDKDIEDFVNSFKSYFGNSTDVIKVVEGSEILHWYLEENYFMPIGKKIGTLWNSCMRYHERNKYMKLYTKNSNIKMAVYLVGDKVRTRALLWDGVSDSKGNPYKIMDRIYSTYDHDTILFKKWAVENGYLPKFHQNAKTEYLFDEGGIPVEKDLTLKLDKWDFIYYPYLDTFKYLSYRKGTLSNSSIFSYDYVLVQSNGGLEPEPEPEPDEYYDDEN